MPGPGGGPGLCGGPALLLWLPLLLLPFPALLPLPGPGPVVRFTSVGCGLLLGGRMTCWIGGGVSTAGVWGGGEGGVDGAECLNRPLRNSAHSPPLQPDKKAGGVG